MKTQLMNKFKLIPFSSTLCVLFFLIGFNVFAQEGTFYAPKKEPKSVFVNVSGDVAYIFEIYRIPDSQGFTGRNVIDTLKKNASGNYEGKISQLNYASEPKMLLIKSFHDQVDVSCELVLKEDGFAYNGSLNNALLNQHSFKLVNEIDSKYPGTNYGPELMINRFYNQEDVNIPFRDYEKKYAEEFQNYADSVNDKFAKYNEIVNELRANLNGISAIDFKTGLDQLPGRDDLTVGYFKAMINELAMSNPSTFFNVVEISEAEVRENEFSVLTKESRKYLLENGPDCEMKDELIKQRRKKVWRDVGLIGIPSALIVVGAATIHTN